MDIVLLFLFCCSVQSNMTIAVYIQVRMWWRKNDYTLAMTWHSLLLNAAVAVAEGGGCIPHLVPPKTKNLHYCNGKEILVDAAVWIWIDLRDSP